MKPEKRDRDYFMPDSYVPPPRPVRVQTPEEQAAKLDLLRKQHGH